MSLGVLNNLNATYAASNLNNTNNSLSKTLQQLSSGSKINSGSDDAAGLSLVNGLQANQQALAQSATNATEGVGLLQVADGALSQVTSLLNRAVTLATEVSNGTLTGNQQTAANQEYQSILNEISNIGSTTTYNQQQVFGNTFNIYTGDSTQAGSSIDKLNISSLNATTTGATVGDTGGAVSYTAGTTAGVTETYTFGTGAAVGDTLATAPTTLSYTNASGAQTATISGSTTSALISSINSQTSTTGVSASWDNTSKSLVLTGTGSVTTVSVGTIKDGATGVGTAQPTGVAGTVSATTAAISYTTTGGVTLAGTKLDNAGDAQSALTTLNSAITAVAAQDGYIGAQINTLNAISSVMSTQQQNIQSAQNAVQATDYATASSNMSKYEILSQTGISALAQANSVQQEVTKLLQ